MIQEIQGPNAPGGMPRFSTVVFDLDGTLLNTLEDLADATNWVCARHGWPVHPLEAYKTFVGNGAANLLKYVAPPVIELTQELQTQTLGEFIRYYNAHSADKTAPYAGIPEVLQRLTEAGVSMAVLTNKPDGAAQPLVEHYYPGVFSAVQGTWPGGPIKPDPAPLFRLLERMAGAKAETTLFVGDSNVDIRTAKNAGLQSCGVLWGFRTREELEAEGADFLAATPEELARLILRGCEE